jgi:hypothetical protein
MKAIVRYLCLAVFAGMSLVPVGAQAQREVVCVTASNAYCEHCTCNYGKTGTGSECWIYRNFVGPSGERCVLCATWGKCSGQIGPSWGLGL